MKILMTGFDPFGGESVNPAWEAVKRVKAPEGVTLVKLEVPTVFGASIDTVLSAMEREKPDAVVCVGQAGGREKITPERVAINVNDARIADNAGQQPDDESICADGPAAYFSTLPIKAMVAAMESAGIGAAVSNTAGTFVCNHLMYGVLCALERQGKSIPAGFIHVPCIPEQTAGTDKPSMPLELIVRGLEAALIALCTDEHKRTTG